MKNEVKRREVFYLSGYDPRGARYYYGLYKKEAELQSKINGLNLKFSSKKRTGKHIQSWEIKASSNEAKTTTNYHFLEWDDLIRSEWKKSVFSLILDLIFYVKAYLLSGAFRKYSKNFPYQMVSLFYPVVYISLIVIFSLVSGWSLFEWVDARYSFLLSITLSFFLVNTIIYLGLLLADKMALFWLLRIFVFSARYVYEKNSILEQRIEYFSTEIIKKLNNLKARETDEVLLVAHSVGAILMIPILSKVLKKIDSTIEISILTLGECIPLVSVIPESTTFKSEMKYIAEQKNITLLDYGTLIDGACFPSLNYFTDININIVYKENFEFKSPRFHTLFSKNKYKEIRRNKYLTHFLYLMSSDIKGNYDYFKMTAGHNFLKKEIR